MYTILEEEQAAWKLVEWMRKTNKHVNFSSARSKFGYSENVSKAAIEVLLEWDLVIGALHKITSRGQVLLHYSLSPLGFTAAIPRPEEAKTPPPMGDFPAPQYIPRFRPLRTMPTLPIRAGAGQGIRPSVVISYPNRTGAI